MPNKEQIEKLLVESRNVWLAFLDYGPVDDGRPEGEAFDAALVKLQEATFVLQCQIGDVKEKKAGRKSKPEA